MRTLSRYLFCIFCLFIPVITFAQIPQELLEKAKAAGMTEEQIQQEMRKRLEQQDTKQVTIPAAEKPDNRSDHNRYRNSSAGFTT